MLRFTSLWTRLRPLVPDLLLAVVIALLVTMAADHLERRETTRIHDDLKAASSGGLTLDEHLDALTASVRRSALVHLPLLAGAGGALVGFGCRRRRWAPLTALIAASPTFLWLVALLADRPVLAGGGVALYGAAAILPAAALATARARLRRSSAHDRAAAT